MTTQAAFNPQAFIELALSRGVLKFGEFDKSLRVKCRLRCHAVLRIFKLR